MPASKTLSLIKTVYDFLLMMVGGAIGALIALYYQQVIGPINSPITLSLTIAVIALTIVPLLFYIRWIIDRTGE